MTTKDKDNTPVQPKVKARVGALRIAAINGETMKQDGRTRAALKRAGVGQEGIEVAETTKPDAKHTGARLKDSDGLTALQAAFAKAVGDGNMTLVKAYQTTFGHQDGRSINAEYDYAWRMSIKPAVKKRIDMWIKRKLASPSHDPLKIRAFLLAKLQEEAENMDSKPADRLKAMELLGKVDTVALFKERSVVEGQLPDNPEDIRLAIDDILKTG